MTNLELTAKDHLYLESLLHAGNQDEAFLQLLRRKLETADVVLPEKLDPRTATIDSRIEFSIGGGGPEQRVLTRHDKPAAEGLPLFVTTLHGLALLGLRAGDVFALRTPAGAIEPLRLEKVSHPAHWVAHRKSRDRNVVAFPSLPAAARYGGPSPSPDDDDPGPRAA